MFRKNAWILFALPLLGAILGFIISAIVTYVTPKQYECTAIIELKPSLAAFRVLHRDSASYFRIEMESLKDADILDSVINDLELTNRWAMEKSQAHDQLAKSLTTEQIRDTDLVAIRTRHINRVDARDITLGIINAYQKRRAASDAKLQREMISALEEAIREQETATEQKRRELASLTEQDPAPQESDEDRLKKPTTIEVAKQDLQAAQDLLESMKLKLKAETIGAEIPYDPAPIHEHPTTPESPVSPNVKFNLILGTGIGMLAGLPLALLILWLISRPERVF